MDSLATLPYEPLPSSLPMPGDPPALSHIVKTEPPFSPGFAALPFPFLSPHLVPLQTLSNPCEPVAQRSLSNGSMNIYGVKTEPLPLPALTYPEPFQPCYEIPSGQLHSATPLGATNIVANQAHNPPTILSTLAGPLKSVNVLKMESVVEQVQSWANQPDSESDLSNDLSLSALSSPCEPASPSEPAREPASPTQKPVRAPAPAHAESKEKKKSRRKKSPAATAAARAPGKRYTRRQEDIERSLNFTRDAIRAMEGDVLEHVRSVTSYPALNETALVDHMPPGHSIDIKEKGPLGPHLFYRSMESKFHLLMQQHLTRLTKVVMAFHSKYRNRIVNNRRQRMGARIDKSEMPKTVFEIAMEQQQQQQNSTKKQDSSSSLSMTTSLPTTETPLPSSPIIKLLPVDRKRKKGTLSVGSA